MIHRVQHPSRPEFRPGAFGVRAVLFALVLVLWVSNCTPVAMPTTDPTPAHPSVPSIEEGTLSTSALAEADRLLQTAKDHLASGNYEEARSTAEGMVQLYPEAPGSGEALEISARAALGLGEAAAAVEAAGRFLALFDISHAVYPEAVLLLGQALAQTGEGQASLEHLVLLPPDAPGETLRPATALLRDVMAGVGTEELRQITQEIPPSHPFRSVLATELAVSLYLGGDQGEAERWAEVALSSVVEPRDEELSRGVLAGNLEELLGEPMILGAILPQSGVSPGLLEYGDWVVEGIQIAAEEYMAELRRPIHLEVLDHGGEAEGGRASVEELEELGSFGAVGPLTPELLSEAAAARKSGLPLISPFASIPLEEAPGVLALTGPDPGGAEVVARYAWDLGLERVVVLRPRTEEARVDTEAFQEAFGVLGGIIPREIVYDSGGTFFQAEFDQVGSLLPDGLFLPLAARDIRLLAPQFTYYGLDTLGIQLLGTTGWTDDEVVLEVDSRHTDGVIASTTRVSQDETVAFQEFRRRYEDRFQKTLRNSVPAYGYDAAALLLMALESNPRNSRELLRALDGIENFAGATGNLTIAGGRIRREPHLVRIQNHELIYISSRFD